MASEELETKMASLMRAALAGDEAAYGAFLRQAADLVRRSVTRRIGVAPLVAAEDIVQETLLAVHLKRQTWRPAAAILPWLMAIARYKTIDAFRRRGVRAAVPIDDVIEVLAAPEAVHDGIHSAEIERAVATLTNGQRRVVRSIAIEGRTIRETATALEMKETAVRVAFHRGLSALAGRFGRQT